MEPVVFNRENGDTYIINPSQVALLRQKHDGNVDGKPQYQYYARFAWGKLHLSSSEFRQLANALVPVQGETE